MVQSKLLFGILIILFIDQRNTFPQIQFKGAVESGYYKTYNSNQENTSSVESNLDLILGYNYKNNESTAGIKIRFKPELYDFENNFYSIKSNISGLYNYNSRGHSISAGGDASVFNFNFGGSQIKYYANLFHLVYSYNISPEKIVRVKTGFSYRQIQVLTSISSDLIFIESSLGNFIGNGTNLWLGIYYEHFNAGEDRNVSYLKSMIENKGFKMGFFSSFDVYADFIFKSEYKLLYVSSDITRSISLEHLFRLAFGYNLSINSTLLLYADLYLNGYKYKDIDYEKYSYYFLANFENSAYFKYGFDVKDNMEIYVKTGYYSIENFEKKGRHNFWNLLFGFEITN